MAREPQALGEGTGVSLVAVEGPALPAPGPRTCSLQNRDHGFLGAALRGGDAGTLGRRLVGKVSGRFSYDVS